MMAFVMAEMTVVNLAVLLADYLGFYWVAYSVDLMVL